LILINRFMNFILKKLNKPPYSFSKKIKANVKNAIKFIGDFEKTASELAIENKYDYVICGHIHEPKIENISNSKGKTTYLNSGDWVESLSALEYNNLEWNLLYHQPEIIDQPKKMKKNENQD
jgi:UDP-2,3-diacylglucosamine pyrophosphatase LpxH